MGGCIGRDSELDRLAGHFAAARAGSPRLVAVEGAAGIGKTSLVRRFVELAGPAELHWASGDEAETHLPWGVLRQLGDQGVARGHAALRELALGLDADADPAFVGAALLPSLAAADVVVIDDAHWADAQSLDALRFAARRLLSEPLLVLVTFRDDPARELGEGWRRIFDGHGGDRMRLGGLDAVALAALAEGVTGVRLSARGAARLHQHTGGHPLYARSLLEQLPAGALEHGTGPLPAPADLSSAVASRLAACSPQAQQAVTCASVLGLRLPVATLTSLMGLAPAEVSAATAEAGAAGLLNETPGSDGTEVEFSHTLVRAAVYGDLGPARRRQLHARAVGCTSGRASLDHRLAASVGPDADLAADMERAAVADLESGLVQRAAIGFSRAVGVAPAAADRRRLALLSAEARLVAGDAHAAAVQLEQMPAGPDDAWSLYVSGYAALLGARVDESEALLRRAWDRSAAGYENRAPADLPARIASQLAIIAVVRLDQVQMVRFGEAAVAAGAADGWVGAFAWFSRLIGMALSGRASSALALAADLDRPSGPGGLDGLVARGMIRLWTDDLAGARSDLSRAVGRATAGAALRVSQAVGYLGEVAYRQGELGEAVVHTELAVVNAAEAGRVWDLPILHALAAYPRAARGEMAEADTHARLSSEWADVMDTAAARSYAALARLAVADARGDESARSAASQDLEVNFRVAELGTHLASACLVETAVTAGRLDEAAARLDRLRRSGRALGRASALMQAARAAGTLAATMGNWDEAVPEFDEAVRRGVALRMPLEVALSRLAAGRAGLRAGHVSWAVGMLSVALTGFAGIDAAAYAGAAASELEAAGFGADLSTATSPVLSPAEATVARLVGDGLTNREVAARLFVSVKTVEFHLRRIYAKLDIRGRQELAGLFRPDRPGYVDRAGRIAYSEGGT
jgi:DNA-binding CsgD family transcriptional regulator